jgi:tungsten cofactor oxidoreducase radical SAM maturase
MMAKVIVTKDGLIQLPPDFLKNHAFNPGMELVFEPREHGVSLYFARPDVKKVYIEVTTACNLNCAMCVRQVWQDRLGSMSEATFHSVLEGLREFPDLKRIVFGGYGEPLLHPRLLDMVAQIHSLGACISLITNGVLLEQRLAEELIRAGVDTLVVSLDSMHIQAYQEAKLEGGLDRVLDNLQGLSELIRDRGWRLPALGLEFVATQSNLAELVQLSKLAKQVGASFVIVNNLLPHTHQMEQEALYDRDKPLQLGGGWGLHRSGWIEWGFPKLPRMKWGARRKCPFVDDLSLTVGWDGAVSPCSALMHSYKYYLYGRKKEVSRYVLGYAGENSLADIWTSEEYVTFRAKVQDFRFPSCVDCGMDCTYAQENNDCFGNFPSCSDCLWAQGILHCP